jgi:hypothetical protein
MKRNRILAAVVAATFCGTAVPAAHAQDQLPPEDTAAAVKFVGKIERHGPGLASIKARYTCSPPANVDEAGPFKTLWLSVKQTKNGKKDTALEQEGSSQQSAAWYQIHRQLVCDGEQHTARMPVDVAEQGKGRLKKGVAYLQWCVISETDSFIRRAWLKVR